MDISQKKPSYRIAPPLRQYLRDFDQETPLPVTYADLARYSNSFALPRQAAFDRDADASAGLAVKSRLAGQGWPRRLAGARAAALQPRVICFCMKWELY